MNQLPAALAPLGAYRQFVLCQFVPIAHKPGKMNKIPLNPATGKPASAHDPAVWLDAATACATATAWGPGYGVGFSFTKVDPFWFLDIDNCLQLDNTWSPLAHQLLAYLPGAAVEVSQSGKGLHIIGSGASPEHGCKNIAAGLEFYTADRFVALTGMGAMGSAATDLSHALPHLVASLFPPGESFNPSTWSDGPCEGWRGPVDDADLLRRAMASKSANSAFGGGASFADLWNAETEVLARAYPDPDRAFDASSADLALAQHLAFWTGKDCERMLRLMQQSALKRDKWERDGYLQHFTIPKAVSRQRDVLADKPPQAPDMPSLPMPAPAGRGDVLVPSEPAPTPRGKPVTGSTFLGGDEQLKMFEGCVYVTSHGGAIVPGGMLVKSDRFKVLYGGYTFSMDPANERTTRDAWEAFTQSQIFRSPKADDVFFKPELTAAAVVKMDGKVWANKWWPVEVPRDVGDASPFFRHLAKVLPDPRDQQILLSYMAACVQHKGHKFGWAPLLQGVEGNGKTLFSECVAQAVSPRYSHIAKPEEISEKFNAWLFDNVFIGVEDVYVPEAKSELLEILKPMITGKRQSRRDMGVAAITTWVCANFLFNSNHKDALRKSRNDRRLAIFYTAQQRLEDLARDGMTGDYFPHLYTWLRNGGYAIVSELLHTYPIPPEFNPAVEAGGQCHRAPDTSSTEAAIQAGHGRLEQEVLEAIDQDTPGFRGGWISSTALGRLLKEQGAEKIAQNKRREMLQAMGYEYHPGLTDGRVNNVVLPDGNKPRLFIKSGHVSASLTGPQIAKAYSEAQLHQGSMAARA